MSVSMIWAIVPRNSGELMTKTAAVCGAGGGTILMGRGTASNAFLELLGLGDSLKDIAIVIVSSEKKAAVFSGMVEAVSDRKAAFGVMFSVPVEDFIRAGKCVNQEKSMGEGENTHLLISVVVNKGFASEAMAAARKAGANGGTVMSARGTAKEGDSKFFGMEIVPEKEMLWIVAENSKAEEIIKSIKDLECLKQPGTGITFTMPASDFTVLGKGKNQ